MTVAQWLQLVAAALGGGFTVKLLDILYLEVRRRFEGSQSARRFVDEHLDPLLKAADELVGKLRSLAVSDFKPLHGVADVHDTFSDNDFASLIYLFGCFWARIEIIRRESLSVSLVSDQRGKHLQNFLDCLESRHVRIVDRISQRAVGELLTNASNSRLGTIDFIEFVTRFEEQPNFRRWIRPLASILTRTRHTASRQTLLQYGVVVHALLDTLDPLHQASRERPSYPGKLSRRTWRDLQYRVFGRYLDFVHNTHKYLGPPKGGPRNG
jgi:hypothetical protein